jgi:hypothetical protein
MYESLTTFIEKLESLKNGNAGKALTDAIVFSDAVNEFVKTHPKLALKNYTFIIKERCQDFLVSDLSEVKLSALDGKTVVALLVKLVEGDARFLLNALTDGTVVKYLHRLNAIDNFSPNQEDVIAAHKHSSFHKKQLQKEQVSGCFCCCKTFSSKKLEFYYDDGQTAYCPCCYIDSVIGESSGYEITEEFLIAMEDYYFGILKRSR